jgi:hypothetical protein
VEGRREGPCDSSRAIAVHSPQHERPDRRSPGFPVGLEHTVDRAELGLATAPAADQGIVLPPAPAPGGFTFGSPTPKNPFTSLGHDLKTFFTQKDTRVIVGVALPAAAVAHTRDQAGIRESQEHLTDSYFEVGNIAGNFLVQTGVAFGTWAIGKAIDNQKTAVVGLDLVRAQFVSQIVVQGVKFATRRQRPDGSDNHSFPSGHTASALPPPASSAATWAGKLVCRRTASRPTWPCPACRRTSTT